MPSIGFTHFKEKLLNGAKRQTIRKLRKRPIKVGDTLYIYWKLRTKECEKLEEAICQETFFINIQFIEDWYGKPIWRVDEVEVPPTLACWTLTDDAVEEIAHRDGFENPLEMMHALAKMHGDLKGIRTFQVIRW